MVQDLYSYEPMTYLMQAKRKRKLYIIARIHILTRNETS